MARRAEKKKESAWETTKTVFWALVIAMAFRSILYQPFSIPSGSMKPTLLVGDYLFVSKYTYGYSRYSFPFAPDLFDGRIWGSMPERGDVVVFKLPSADTCSEYPHEWALRLVSNVGAMFGLSRPIRDPNDCVDYIKRVTGLPGDRIQMIDGVLHVNGQKVGLEPDGMFADEKSTDGEVSGLQRCANGEVAQGGVCKIPQYVEELPGGVRHMVLDSGPTPVDNTAEFVVQPGHLFFMGDNRDNSQDSRFPSPGQVPVENLIGRAEIIGLSSAGAFWQVWKWRGSRFIKSIQ